MSKQQLLKSIQAALQAGSFEEAIPLCEDALQTDLNDAQKASICVQLGNCYVQTKQLNKAADAFTQATSLQPSMPQAWKGLSDVHLAQKHWDKYGQALERMFEIAVSKGNVARGNQLAKRIADAYRTAGTAAGRQLQLQWLTRYQQQLESTTEDRTQQLQMKLRCLCEAAHTQELNIRQLQADAVASLSTASQAKQVAESEEAMKQLKRTAHELLAVLTELRGWPAEQPGDDAAKDAGAEDDAGVSAAQLEQSFLSRSLDAVREEGCAFLLRMAICLREAARSKKAWQELASFARQASDVGQVKAAARFLLEAYFYLPELNAAELQLAYDAAVTVDPSDPVPQAFKAFVHAERGESAQARAAGVQCLELYRRRQLELDEAMKATLLNVAVTSKQSQQVSRHALAVSNLVKLPNCCVAAFVVVLSLSEFRSISVSDALYWTSHALRITSGKSHGSDVLSQMNAVPFARDMDVLLPLARVIILARVSQGGSGKVRHTCVTYLPAFFSAIATEMLKPTTGELEEIIQEEVKVEEIEEDLQAADDVSEHEETDIEAARGILEEFQFLDAEIAERSVLFQRAMAMALTQLGMYKDAIDLLTKLAAREPPAELRPVVSSDLAWVELQQYVAQASDITTPAVPAERVQAILSELQQHVATTKDALGYFRLGVAMWHCGGQFREDKTQCVAALLTAAKLDPAYAPTFTYLGHYYCLVGGNADRGRKCYLKAVQLDALERAAGEAMVKAYITDNQKEVCLQFLNDVIHSNEHAQWPFAALGRIFLFREGDEEQDEKNLQRAEDNLQEALRLIHDDAGTWELLGSCYLRQRKHWPALKAYLEAVKFAPQSVHALVGVAEAYKRLALIDEAVDFYRRAQALVAAGSADKMAAYIAHGFADALLAQAYIRLTSGWQSGAAESIVQGYTMLHDAASKDSHNCLTDKASVYKLLGDLATFSYHIGPSCFVPVVEGVEAEDKTTTSKAGVKDVDAANDQLMAHTAGLGLGVGIGASLPQYEPLLEWLTRGEQAYQRVVELVDADSESSADQEARAQFDLGFNYFQQAHIRLTCAQPVGTKLYDAFRAFQTAIEAAPEEAVAWNGLGATLLLYALATAFDGKLVVDMPVQDAPSALLRAQHCFVRAVQLQREPSALANLALLFLILGMDDASRQSYSALQLVEHHPIMWIGIGMLWERSTEVSAEQRAKFVKDAYTAALEVTKFADALIGRAVACIRANQLTDAESFIVMYLQRQPGSFQGWIIFASLLEARRSYHCAQYAYTMALSYLQAVQVTQQFAVSPKAFVTAAIDRCRVAMASTPSSLAAVADLIRNVSAAARDRTIDTIALIKCFVLDEKWDQAKAAIDEAFAKSDDDNDASVRFQLRALQLLLPTTTVAAQLPEFLRAYPTEVAALQLALLLAAGGNCEASEQLAMSVQPCQLTQSIVAQRPGSNNACLQAILGHVAEGLKLHTASPSYTRYACEILLGAGKIDEAEKLAKRCVHMFGHDAEAWLALDRALTYQRPARPAACRRCADAAIVLSNQDIMAALNDDSNKLVQHRTAHIGSSVHHFAAGVASRCFYGVQHGEHAPSWIRRSIRSALRFDPTNMQLWEALAYVTYAEALRRPTFNSHEQLKLACNIWSFLVENAVQTDTASTAGAVGAAYPALSISSLAAVVMTDSEPAGSDARTAALRAALAGDYDSAIRSYKQAVAETSASDAFRVWREMGCAYLLMGKVPAAEYAFNTSTRLLEPLDEAQRAFETALNQLLCGVAFYHSAQPNKAKAYVDKASKALPNHAAAHVAKGAVYKKLGKDKQADESFDAARNLQAGIVLPST